LGSKALFKRVGIIAMLRLDEKKVARFLIAIEAGYRDHPEGPCWPLRNPRL